MQSVATKIETLKKQRQALYQKRIEMEFIPFASLQDPGSHFWVIQSELTPDMANWHIIDSFCKWRSVREEATLILNDLLRIKKHGEYDLVVLYAALVS